MMNFGENLQTLRKLKNYSQEDLIDKLQVSRHAVSKWESGLRLGQMTPRLFLCKYNCIYEFFF